MLSLIILLVGTLLQLLASAWATAAAARAAGSGRGRFAVGLMAIGATLLVSIALQGLGAVLPHGWNSAMFGLVLTPALGLIYLAALFVIFRRLFVLKSLRPLAPLGAFIAVALTFLMIAFLLVKPYVIEAFVLSTASMAPTLVPGDRFVVNRLLTPRRFDIVAYHPEVDRAVVYAHRLIGLPGERLRFAGGSLYINDVKIDAPPPLAGRLTAAPLAAPPESRRYREGQEIQLGPDDYFLVGDHLDVAADSRVRGPIPRPDLVGVADLIYWPAGKLRVLR